MSEPVVNQLLSLQPHYSSPEALITFIGLDKEPPPNHPPNGQVINFYFLLNICKYHGYDEDRVKNTNLAPIRYD